MDPATPTQRSLATRQILGLALPAGPAVLSVSAPRNTREGPRAGRKAGTETNEAIRRGHCIFWVAPRTHVLHVSHR